MRLLLLNIVPGVLSLPVLLLQYLAPADIANRETDVTLEWRVVGICMMVLTAFAVVTIVTLTRASRLAGQTDVLVERPEACG